MLKVLYTYYGDSGELELDSVINFDSMDEIQAKFGISTELPTCVTETLLSKLAPNKIFKHPETKAQKRGGERNIQSDKELAEVNGFTKLQYSLGERTESIF